MRGVKGRDEPEAGFPGPKLGFGFQPGPDLLLGRAPPARGFPLLVVKGRVVEVGRSKPERLGRGLSVPGRSVYDRGALGRVPPA